MQKSKVKKERAVTPLLQENEDRVRKMLSIMDETKSKYIDPRSYQSHAMSNAKSHLVRDTDRSSIERPSRVDKV